MWTDSCWITWKLQVSPRWTLFSQDQFPGFASSIVSFPKCLIYPPSSSAHCFPVSFCWIQLMPYLAFQHPPHTEKPRFTANFFSTLESGFLFTECSFLVLWWGIFCMPFPSHTSLPTNLIPQTLQCQLWKIFCWGGTQEIAPLCIAMQSYTL